MSHRDDFIAGLRALADWLRANPAAPIPPYGHDIRNHALCGDDTLGWSSVDAFAMALGLATQGDIGEGEVHCRKEFPGGLVWSYRYLARRRVEQHDALMSYRGAVQPDTSPAGAP